MSANDVFINHQKVIILWIARILCAKPIEKYAEWKKREIDADILEMIRV